MESCVPPGFRFHPTEEELVGYYLKRKINSQKIDLDVIVDIDLYNMEPWDIQGSCRVEHEEQNEWYFFSHKDRKYPTGTRTNRATRAGFWKATGRDKSVFLKNNTLIGMRKTLVFYTGRAPNGRKTDWILHEYRLQSSLLSPPQEEGWVVCRAFRKPSPIQNQATGAWKNHLHLHHHHHQQNFLKNDSQVFTFQQHFSDFPYNNSTSSDMNQLVELPNLGSPSLDFKDFDDGKTDHGGVEWNVLDNFLSSPITETSSSSYPKFSPAQSQSHCGYGSFVDL